MKFYVYVLFRPWNGEPCYVGKGSGNRIAAHAQYGPRHPNEHLARILVKAGGSIPAVILHAGLTEDQALSYEVALIAAIGRESAGGPLVNMTDGGEGVSGATWKATSSQIEKSRQAKLGKPRDAMTRAKLSAANMGKTLSEESRHKLSESLKASPKAARHIVDLANSSRGKPLSNEHREKLRQANIGIPFSDERRKAISDAQRGKRRGPLSPEALDHRRQTHKGYERTEAYRELARQNAIRQHEERRVKAFKESLS